MRSARFIISRTKRERTRVLRVLVRVKSFVFFKFYFASILSIFLELPSSAEIQDALMTRCWFSFVLIFFAHFRSYFVHAFVVLFFEFVVTIRFIERVYSLFSKIACFFSCWTEVCVGQADSVMLIADGSAAFRQVLCSDPCACLSLLTSLGISLGKRTALVLVRPRGWVLIDFFNVWISCEIRFEWLGIRNLQFFYYYLLLFS